MVEGIGPYEVWHSSCSYGLKRLISTHRVPIGHLSGKDHPSLVLFLQPPCHVAQAEGEVRDEGLSEDWSASDLAMDNYTPDPEF